MRYRLDDGSHEVHERTTEQGAGVLPWQRDPHELPHGDTGPVTGGP